MNGKGGVRVIAFGLFVQMFLFSSCEKEIAENGSGRKVDIIFAVDNGEDAVNETVVRSAGMGEPETKVVPLGFDDLYLYATLRPDTTPQLRAPKAFADGQKICLAAFTPGGVQIGTTAVYTYSSSLGKLIAPANPVGVDPNNSTVYRFVAYSYFADPTLAPPVTVPATGIDPAKDLVWGFVETKIADTNLGRTVTIKMNHKMAQVKMTVKVTGISGATIRSMSDVVVEGGTYASLTPISGAISPGAAVVQELLSWSPMNQNTTTCVARPVYPVASPGKANVTIGGMTIRVSGVDYPVSSFPIEFNSDLAEGSSYLLEVSLNRMAFAGSNVYWDSGEGKMKFDVQHSGAGKYYQGVYFQFQSLVGYSPVDGTIYVPNVSNGTWAVGSGSATVEGDICYYINNAWQVPEGTALDAILSGNSQVSGTTSGLNAQGTGSITAGRQFNTGKGTLFLPFSGGGSSTLTTAQGEVGASARYWSSTRDIGGATYSRWCLYLAPGATASYSYLRVTGYDSFLPVRCVRSN